MRYLQVLTVLREVVLAVQAVERTIPQGKARDKHAVARKQVDHAWVGTEKVGFALSTDLDRAIHLIVELEKRMAGETDVETVQTPAPSPDPPPDGPVLTESGRAAMREAWGLEDPPSTPDPEPGSLHADLQASDEMLADEDLR